MASAIHSTHGVKGIMRYQEWGGRVGARSVDSLLLHSSATGTHSKSWIHGSLKKETAIKLHDHHFSFVGTGMTGSNTVLLVGQSGPLGYVSVNNLLQTSSLKTTQTNFISTGSDKIDAQSLYVSDGSDGQTIGSLIFKSSDGVLHDLISQRELSVTETKESNDLNSSFQIVNIERSNDPIIGGQLGPLDGRTLMSLLDEIGYSAYTGPAGMIGEKGDTGLQGEIGPTGAPGRDGLKGEIGHTGLQGDRGERGLQGEIGPIGMKGDKGDRGECGLQGERGLDGLNGENGRDGLQGEMGPRGNDGLNGPTGASGKAGKRGRKGSKGDQGEIGPMGPSIIGPTGADGLRGFVGHTGPRGLMGDKGNCGNTGPTGAPGLAVQGVEYGDYLFWDPLSNSFITDGKSIHLGSNAGLNSSLTGSIMIGYEAGRESKDANSVFVGYQAGLKTTGQFDVGIGYKALSIGSKSGILPTDPTCFTGTFNTVLGSIAVGTHAGASAYPGPGFTGDGMGNYYLNSGREFAAIAGNISIGAFAGINASGPSNVAIGNGAGGGGGGFAMEEPMNGGTIIAFQTGPFVGGQQGMAVAIGTASGVISQGLGSVAIGTTAGFYEQGEHAVAVGLGAGAQGQGANAVAYGREAGNTSQGESAVAIGGGAGIQDQGVRSVAIGDHAGSVLQGHHSVAIGPFAGENAQAAGSIVINASEHPLNATSTGLFIHPIREDPVGDFGLSYNPFTSELTYNTSKTFVIPHPTKSDHLLVHACLEGPESAVFYRGESVIGEDGFVEVELPEYANVLASGWTVHITQIYSEEEYKAPRPTSVVNGKFRVYGKGGFYWLAIGRRTGIVVEPSRQSVKVRGDGPYKYIDRD
jgi:Collagen triple helix repeat (20 copies)